MRKQTPDVDFGIPNHIRVALITVISIFVLLTVVTTGVIAEEESFENNTEELLDEVDNESIEEFFEEENITVEDIDSEDIDEYVGEEDEDWFTFEVTDGSHIYIKIGDFFEYSFTLGSGTDVDLNTTINESGEGYEEIYDASTEYDYFNIDIHNKYAVVNDGKVTELNIVVKPYPGSPDLDLSDKKIVYKNYSDSNYYSINPPAGVSYNTNPENISSSAGEYDIEIVRAENHDMLVSDMQDMYIVQIELPEEHHISEGDTYAFHMSENENADFIVNPDNIKSYEDGDEIKLNYY